MDNFNITFSTIDFRDYDVWKAEGLAGEFIDGLIFDRKLIVFQDNDEEFYSRFKIYFLQKREEYLQRFAAR
jgi:hypothetical protein